MSSSKLVGGKQPRRACHHARLGCMHAYVPYQKTIDDFLPRRLNTSNAAVYATEKRED
jgi:hypothetical protein